MPAKLTEAERAQLGELLQRWWTTDGRGTLVGRLMNLPRRAEQAALTWLDARILRNRRELVAEHLRSREGWVVQRAGTGHGYVFLTFGEADAFLRKVTRRPRRETRPEQAPETPAEPTTSEPVPEEWVGPVPLEFAFLDGAEGLPPTAWGLVGAGVILITAIARLFAAGAPASR